MFKIAKQMKQERKDIVGGVYVKDENENILVEEQDIKEEEEEEEEKARKNVAYKKRQKN